MFERIKELFHKPKPAPKVSWQQALRRLGKELVPLSGEAETLQGEVVRCIANLNNEATRNGWMNWDEGDVESVNVLRRYLPDSDVFSDDICRQIHKALDAVCSAGKREAGKGVFAYEELSFLAQQVAEWCVFYSELEYKNPEATWLDEDPFRETRDG